MPANAAAGPVGPTPSKIGARQKEEPSQPQGIPLLQAPAVLGNVGIKALLAAAKAAKVRPETAHGGHRGLLQSFVVFASLKG